jgi:threonine/homoserine/homoserine lactone efflux protein
MSNLAAFVLLAVVVIVTPGPDTALTVRNALLGGRPGGLFTALGVSTGQAVWALAASAGIAAFLRASEPAFNAVRYAGAAYIVVLGVQSLLAAVRGGGAHEVSASAPRRHRLSPARAYRQGLLSDLGNPKMAVFFVSLLPQFASGGQGAFIAPLLLGLLFSAMTLVWLSGYAVAVAKAGDLFRRQRVKRALDALTGGVLVALGLRLAAERA